MVRVGSIGAGKKLFVSIVISQIYPSQKGMDESKNAKKFNPQQMSSRCA
jgi:hypothetical protein